MSVREALDGAATAIAAAGCETPRLDAELLVAHVLGVPRERLFTDPDPAVSGPAVRALQDAVRRRAVEREPVAYITGVRCFRRLELAVDPRVLIPRPETELLVEVALARLPRGASVLDVGTGSGAIALALADERPDLAVAGSDVSDDALVVARANAARLGLDGVEWLQADLLEAVPDAFDAVLSNPPYVADGERAALAPEILRHEPAGALFAGPDGLDRIRALIVQAATRERVRLLMLEVGAGQATAVEELMCRVGFADVRAERDLAGIERVVIGARHLSKCESACVLNAAEVRRLQQSLTAGGVVVFPTDTVYGLGCDPDDEVAVRRLYELKGRPPERPAAIMFFALPAALDALPELSERERAAIAALLPGPLTILLPNRQRRYPLACGPNPLTLGLRVPRLPPRLAALEGLERPLLQSSANFSGEPDSCALSQVPAEMRAGADLVLDGGELPGTASTVLDLNKYERTGEWQIVRAGPVGEVEIERILGSC